MKSITCLSITTWQIEMMQTRYTTKSHINIDDDNEMNTNNAKENTQQV